MRKAARVAILIALAVPVAVFARASVQSHSLGRQQQFEQPPLPASQSPAGTAPSQPATQPAQKALQTVVLDAAHGGTDEGAHGAGGIVEKDVVLALAQTVQKRLERDGWNVVMTRKSDQTLSFEQRAAIANAQPNAVFITLHVGSSSPVGSAYAYYYDFGQVVENRPETPTGGLVSWDRAQAGWESLSRRFAELLQVELSVRFKGSPELPTGAPVYQLREIAEPAVAIEIENVNAPSAAALKAFGKPLAQAISRALQAFRLVYQNETR